MTARLAKGGETCVVCGNSIPYLDGEWVERWGYAGFMHDYCQLALWNKELQGQETITQEAPHAD